MRAEYDFSSGVRGKHFEAYRRGTNVVLLEPDVAEVFKDSATVNSALRVLAQNSPGACFNAGNEPLIGRLMNAA